MGATYHRSFSLTNSSPEERERLIDSDRRAIHDDYFGQGTGSALPHLAPRTAEGGPIDIHTHTLANPAGAGEGAVSAPSSLAPAGEGKSIDIHTHTLANPAGAGKSIDIHTHTLANPAGVGEGAVSAPSSLTPAGAGKSIDIHTHTLANPAGVGEGAVSAPSSLTPAGAGKSIDIHTHTLANPAGVGEGAVSAPSSLAPAGAGKSIDIHRHIGDPLGAGKCVSVASPSIGSPAGNGWLVGIYTPVGNPAVGADGTLSSLSQSSPSSARAGRIVNGLTSRERRYSANPKLAYTQRRLDEYADYLRAFHCDSLALQVAVQGRLAEIAALRHAVDEQDAEERGINPVGKTEAVQSGNEEANADMASLDEARDVDAYPPPYMRSDPYREQTIRSLLYPIGLTDLFAGDPACTTPPTKGAPACGPNTSELRPWTYNDEVYRSSEALNAYQKARAEDRRLYREERGLTSWYARFCDFWPKFLNPCSSSTGIPV